jgi:hypothetical protein
MCVCVCAYLCVCLVVVALRVLVVVAGSLGVVKRKEGSSHVTTGAR